MPSEGVVVEQAEVPCVCGNGLIGVVVTCRREGVMSFRVTEAKPCPVCGSTEIRDARLKGLFQPQK